MTMKKSQVAAFLSDGGNILNLTISNIMSNSNATINTYGKNKEVPYFQILNILKADMKCNIMVTGISVYMCFASSIISKYLILSLS